MEYTNLITTAHNQFINRVRQYYTNANAVDIIVGFISLQGLELICKELSVPQKTRILVGYQHKNCLDVEYMLNHSECMSSKNLGNENLYDYYRRLVKEDRLEIIFNKDLKLHHAKGYLFNTKVKDEFFSIVGSNNLTKSGLIINNEWAIETNSKQVYLKSLEMFEFSYLEMKQNLLELPNRIYRGRVIYSYLKELSDNKYTLHFKLLIEYNNNHYIVNYKLSNNKLKKMTDYFIDKGATNIFDYAGCVYNEFLSIVKENGKFRIM